MSVHELRSARDMSESITRTITLDDLTAAELARLFANMASDDQAEFFNALYGEVEDWPGAGWCWR